jgi:BirA family biotin operon repressor/biotin-[acetyl-CoA-carboxylase] ligase
MLTSLAIVKAIKNTTALNPQIKWPNDIYVGDKKIGGILTEFNADQDRVDFVVVGVGLNVNFDPSIYPEIKDTATSLKEVLGKDVSRIELLQSILREIEEGCNSLEEGRASQIRNEWSTYSLITGKPVRITSFGTIEEGIAESVDKDGCLVLRDGEGKRKRILSGDVSLRLNG